MLFNSVLFNYPKKPEESRLYFAENAKRVVIFSCESYLKYFYPDKHVANVKKDACRKEFSGS